MTSRNRIQVTVDDITKLDLDAIVNAANQRMLGGGGVDGAIHRAAGPGLKAECERVEEVSPNVRCPTGQARITGGYNLPAKHVIHTAGPRWAGGGKGEADLLASCYSESLRLAAEHKLGSIAFPAISTGVYGYPKDQAAEVALRAVRGFLDENALPRTVIFCCFNEEDAETYRRLLT